jgi:AcrR family transcriptional regulator
MLTAVLEQKKRNKREALLSSAFDLFLEKGPLNTSIDDIVKKAGIAKGTFYLYFRDRNDILEAILADKGKELLRASVNDASLRSPCSSEEEMVFVIDALIERLKADPRLIGLFYKNFSWKGIMNSLPREEVRSPIERLSKGRSSRNFEMTSFVILELVFSVLYGSIVLGDASEVEEIKPFLLHSVARLLAKDP